MDVVGSRCPHVMGRSAAAGGSGTSAPDTAMGVFRPDLYDAALGAAKPVEAVRPIGAFAGPPFDPQDIAGHLSAFAIRRSQR